MVFQKFLVVPISGNSFLNESLEYGCLECALIAKFSEPSLWFMLMYASERRREYLAKKQVLGVYLVGAIIIIIFLLNEYFNRIILQSYHTYTHIYNVISEVLHKKLYKIKI